MSIYSRPIQPPSRESCKRWRTGSGCTSTRLRAHPWQTATSHLYSLGLLPWWLQTIAFQSLSTARATFHRAERLQRNYLSRRLLRWPRLSPFRAKSWWSLSLFLVPGQPRFFWETKGFFHRVCKGASSVKIKEIRSIRAGKSDSYDLLFTKFSSAPRHSTCAENHKKLPL